MRKFELSVNAYRLKIKVDPDVVAMFPDEEEREQAVESMVKTYAVDKQLHKQKIIERKKQAPILNMRKRMMEKYGFVDENFIQRKIAGGRIDFDPFTEDPNCKSCRKLSKKKG